MPNEGNSEGLVRLTPPKNSKGKIRFFKTGYNGVHLEMCTCFTQQIVSLLYVRYCTKW